MGLASQSSFIIESDFSQIPSKFLFVTQVGKIFDRNVPCLSHLGGARLKGSELQRAIEAELLS